MKTCKNCGTKNFDTNSRCDKCFYPFLSPAEELRAKAPSNLALAARIFLIINIVVGILGGFLSLCGLIVLLSVGLSNYYFGSFELAVLLIYFIPLVVLIIALTVISFIILKHYDNKIYNGEQPSLAFKICTLLFLSLIAGILMLCDDKSKESAPKTVYQPQSGVAESIKASELKQFKELLDSGIITQEEFDKKKKEILGL